MLVGACIPIEMYLSVYYLVSNTAFLHYVVIKLLTVKVKFLRYLGPSGKELINLRKAYYARMFSWIISSLTILLLWLPEFMSLVGPSFTDRYRSLVSSPIIPTRILSAPGLAPKTAGAAIMPIEKPLEIEPKLRKEDLQFMVHLTLTLGILTATQWLKDYPNYRHWACGLNPSLVGEERITLLFECYLLLTANWYFNAMR